MCPMSPLPLDDPTVTLIAQVVNMAPDNEYPRRRPRSSLLISRVHDGGASSNRRKIRGKSWCFEPGARSRILGDIWQSLSLFRGLFAVERRRAKVKGVFYIFSWIGTTC